MTPLSAALTIAGIILPVIIALLLIINKMHNGRVDNLDKREAENNRIHLQNHRVINTKLDEERKANEERATRVYDKLDKVTDHISDLTASIAGNYVTKDDCHNCRGS